MAHGHNSFALRYGDEIVRSAAASDPAARSSPAAGRSLLHSGTARATFVGVHCLPRSWAWPLCMPFPFAVYQGWVGGIVSVDRNHVSRLGSPREGFYYLGVLILQLIPYTLAGGTGVRLGLAFVMPAGRYGYRDPQRWLGLPAEGVRDVARIYCRDRAAVPRGVSGRVPVAMSNRRPTGR